MATSALPDRSLWSAYLSALPLALPVSVPEVGDAKQSAYPDHRSGYQPKREQLAMHGAHVIKIKHHGRSARSAS